MRKIVKWVGIVLGLLLFICVIGFLCLVLFVSPNRFKPLIIEEVKKTTGRNLVIDGDLSWTVYPYLGVKVGHLELDNPTEFKQKVFAEIQSGTLGVHVLPLLHGKIESSGIALKGLNLHLIKNAQGQTNWNLMLPSETANAHAETKTEKNIAHKPLGLRVSAIDISKAMIDWVDEQKKVSYAIQQLELHAQNINVTKPFPLEAFFNYNSPSSDVSGSISLNGKMAFNPDKQTIFLDELNLHSKIQKQNKKLDVSLQGNMAADFVNQRMNLGNLIAQIANLKLSGNVSINHFSHNMTASGQIRIYPLDVKKWLQATGQDVSALQTCKDLTGSIDFNGGLSLSGMHAKGNLKINDIQVSNLRLKEAVMELQMQNGVVALAPINAEIYQGRLDAQMKVDLNHAVPQMSLQGKLVNIQAEPLWADLAKKQKITFSGTGNFDLQVTASGSTKEAIMKDLNGTAKLNFNQGVLKGIDIGYLVDSAIALANKQPMPTTNTDQTEFGTLTATAVIHGGLIKNQDLYINSPRFDTKGAGQVSLPDQQIDYHLQSIVKQTPGVDKNNLSNLYGFPIPIVIKGNLSNPDIRLDMEALMKSIAGKEIQKAKERLQEKIKDKVPGKAGEFLNNLLGH